MLHAQNQHRILRFPKPELLLNKIFLICKLANQSRTKWVQKTKTTDVLNVSKNSFFLFASGLVCFILSKRSKNHCTLIYSKVVPRKTLYGKYMH